MQSSFKEDDVTLLLKDITGLVKPQSTEEREKAIQSGTHYCEMLPIEYKPSDEYMKLYDMLVDTFAQDVSVAVARLADKLYQARGKDLVLVSLARAGIPAGILVKRYLRYKYGIDVPHYAISIIRGRGIDSNALDYILTRHIADKLVFIDGWTGKGAIDNQLKDALLEYPFIPAELAVIADPAGVAMYYGTREDLLIPSCCLNSTISGLISRTFLRDDIIGKDDFHGAVYYDNLKAYDLTYDFIDAVVNEFAIDVGVEEPIDYSDTGADEAKEIAEHYGIHDINLVKPSIGETTRVLLRRVPDKILIDKKSRGREVAHIKELAYEKGVPIEYIHMRHYKACGLIKELGDI